MEIIFNIFVKLNIKLQNNFYTLVYTPLTPNKRPTSSNTLCFLCFIIQEAKCCCFFQERKKYKQPLSCYINDKISPWLIFSCIFFLSKSKLLLLIYCGLYFHAYFASQNVSIKSMVFRCCSLPITN